MPSFRFAADSENIFGLPLARRSGNCAPRFPGYGRRLEGARNTCASVSLRSMRGLRADSSQRLVWRMVAEKTSAAFEARPAIGLVTKTRRNV